MPADRLTVDEVMTLVRNHRGSCTTRYSEAAAEWEAELSFEVRGCAYSFTGYGQQPHAAIKSAGELLLNRFEDVNIFEN